MTSRSAFRELPRLRLRATDEEAVAHLIAPAAARYEISPRALELLLLLHLPRVADKTGGVTANDANTEAQRLAQWLQYRDRRWCHLIMPPPTRLSSPTSLTIGTVDDETARPIEEFFHYLRSWRQDGARFGARHEDRVAALATLVQLDVDPITATLPAGVNPTEALIVARTFAFDWAPRNTMSFMLSRVANAVGSGQATRLLLTYLNPNLGFTGASYRAANWRLYGYEHGTRYAYLDCDYIADRELRRRFGTACESQLRRQLGSRIAFSKMELKPLEIYGLFLDKHSRQRTERHRPIDLSRSGNS